MHGIASLRERAKWFPERLSTATVAKSGRVKEKARRSAPVASRGSASLYPGNAAVLRELVKVSANASERSARQSRIDLGARLRSMWNWSFLHQLLLLLHPFQEREHAVLIGPKAAYWMWSVERRSGQGSLRIRQRKDAGMDIT